MDVCPHLQGLGGRRGEPCCVCVFLCDLVPISVLIVWHIGSDLPVDSVLLLVCPSLILTALSSGACNVGSRHILTAHAGVPSVAWFILTTAVADAWCFAINAQKRVQCIPSAIVCGVGSSTKEVGVAVFRQHLCVLASGAAVASMALLHIPAAAWTQNVYIAGRGPGRMKQ